MCCPYSEKESPGLKIRSTIVKRENGREIGTAQRVVSARPAFGEMGSVLNGMPFDKFKLPSACLTASTVLYINTACLSCLHGLIRSFRLWSFDALHGLRPLRELLPQNHRHSIC